MKNNFLAITLEEALKEKESYYKWGIIGKLAYNKFYLYMIPKHFRNIKYRLQRFKKGWADEDWWNMNYRLGNIMPQLFEEWIRNYYGYPWDTTEKGWIKELTAIKRAFEILRDKINVCEKLTEQESKEYDYGMKLFIKRLKQKDMWD